jgi:large subunit ribosomal protein L20
LPRAKGGIKARRRHKSVLQAVRGHRGSRNRRYKIAHESLLHAMAYSTEHRKLKKRQNRSLAIVRINAAARANGITYRELIHGMKVAGVGLDRKSLSDLAVREPAAFAEVVNTVRASLTAA